MNHKAVKRRRVLQQQLLFLHAWRAHLGNPQAATVACGISWLTHREWLSSDVSYARKFQALNEELERENFKIAYENIAQMAARGSKDARRFLKDFKLSRRHLAQN